MAELDIEGILANLIGRDVEFLVIGGVAVGFHGYIRATKDLDVVPAPDRENLKRLASVLQGLEAQTDILQWLGDEALWEKLSPAAQEVVLGELRVKVVSYEDLVALKEQAGREQDLQDLKLLRQARGE